MINLIMWYDVSRSCEFFKEFSLIIFFSDSNLKTVFSAASLRQQRCQEASKDQSRCTINADSFLWAIKECTVNFSPQAIWHAVQ